MRRWDFQLWGPLLLLGLCFLPGCERNRDCVPTPEDEMGPFYQPGAPLRSSVGQGYVMFGTVRSAVDCTPLAGAMIELWMAGPSGRYDDAHRATIVSDRQGNYRFTSDFPPDYVGRPPHVHLRVSAEGFPPLVTQHYPPPGMKEGRFDLVLVPGN